MTNCAVTGCVRYVHMKGLCRKHYLRVVEYGTVEPSPGRPVRLCSHKDCKRKHYAKGYCSMHYQRYRNGLDMDYVKVIPPCSQEGCERESNTHGLCASHYSQLWRGGEVKELRPMLPAGYHRRRKGRECTCCGEYKNFSEFYRLAKDREGYFSNCKRCVLAKQKVNNYKRGKGPYPSEAIKFLQSVGAETL